MDNLGGASKKANQFGAHEQHEQADNLQGSIDEAKFAEFLNERSDLRPDELEKPMEAITSGETIGAEDGSETGAAIEPEKKVDQPKSDSGKKEQPDDKTPEEAEIAEIYVPHDAKEIPKKFVNQVKKCAQKYEKNPREFLNIADFARWTYLKGAYDRELGDGLDGQGAA